MEAVSLFTHGCNSREMNLQWNNRGAKAGAHTGNIHQGHSSTSPTCSPKPAEGCCVGVPMMSTGPGESQRVRKHLNRPVSALCQEVSMCGHFRNGSQRRAHPACSELWAKSSEIYRNIPSPTQWALNQGLRSGGFG